MERDVATGRLSAVGWRVAAGNACLLLLLLPGHVNAQRPNCDDLQFTQAQVQQAFDAAYARYAARIDRRVARGQEVHLWDSRYLLKVWKRMGWELGCTMPIAPRYQVPPGAPVGAEPQSSPSEPGAAGVATTIAGCGSYANIIPAVSYCGSDDSRKHPMPATAEPRLNRACFAHDSCYCRDCIRSTCMFSQADEVRACDAPLLRTCTELLAEPHPLTTTRAICVMVNGLVELGMANISCLSAPTRCSGACDSSVCYRGICQPVVDAGGASRLGASSPFSARVMRDWHYCANLPCGVVQGCIGGHQAEVGFFDCEGRVLPNGFCYGEDYSQGFAPQCGQLCGEYVCDGYYHDSAWDKVHECIGARGYPQVPGDPEAGTVVYFGSRRQLEACLGCAPPIL